MYMKVIYLVVAILTSLEIWKSITYESKYLRYKILEILELSQSKNFKNSWFSSSDSFIRYIWINIFRIFTNLIALESR